MVGRLVQLMQYANATTTQRSGCKHRRAELILRHSLRARKGEEDAAWTYLLEGTKVEARVAFEGIAQRILMLRKSWRVKDDEVVGIIFHLLQELEGVFGKGFMARVTREVQFYVGIHQIYGLGRTVHGMHFLCPTAHGINRKAASVAEHIQHRATMGILLDQCTVVALVNEEAGLLTSKPVDMETEAVLYGYIIEVAAGKEAVLLTEVGLERQCRLAFIIDVIKL